jgi:hypothetical protein
LFSGIRNAKRIESTNIPKNLITVEIKNTDFSILTSKEIRRLVNSGDMMSCLDDKSGYDHILLHENSRKYFGIQFGGFYLVLLNIDEIIKAY